MHSRVVNILFLVGLIFIGGVANSDQSAVASHVMDTSLGRVAVSTIPLDEKYTVRSATYTPSGNVLVFYEEGEEKTAGRVDLAVVADDGTNFRRFFSQVIPLREKDNGIRFMVFPDNRRIFLGDFIIECAPSIDRCDQSALYPVEYPAEVAGGDLIAHRWSEIIVAPDNQHVAWTTLLANYSAVVFTGRLKKEQAGYKIINPRIISTTEVFIDDGENPGAVLPAPVRGGEVKQFVQGGTAISLVGARWRDTADSVVQDLSEGRVTAITNTPGYNETTIFSPDEKIGITMTPRFSESSDLAILGLMPRPYPASLNMGLNMHAYTYSVTGVRGARSGNIGPALIEIETSKNEAGYLGINLNTENDWVFRSPMSWHPDGKKALWPEGLRGAKSRYDTEIRLQVAHLMDYEPGPAIAARVTPDDIPYASSDLSLVADLASRGREVKVRVKGRHSGHIQYSRSAGGQIEKIYVDFSDDGESVYTGSEKIQLNPNGESTYTADVKLTGPRSGVMALKMTFGPLGDTFPAKLIFARDASGTPLTHGYAEFSGQRLSVDRLTP